MNLDPWICSNQSTLTVYFCVSNDVAGWRQCLLRLHMLVLPRCLGSSLWVNRSDMVFTWAHILTRKLSWKNRCVMLIVRATACTLKCQWSVTRHVAHDGQGQLCDWRWGRFVVSLCNMCCQLVVGVLRLNTCRGAGDGPALLSQIDLILVICLDMLLSVSFMQWTKESCFWKNPSIVILPSYS